MLMQSTEPAPEGSVDSEELSPIQVTAGKFRSSANDTATAVSVVTRDEIKERPNALLPDLLRGESGVYIQQTTPGQGIPIIRGLKGSQNVHLVDGLRLNTAFFRNAPNQYLALVDPFLTEQIEVVRGPASVLYGGDALGGVVNIISHTPIFVGQDVQYEGQVFTSFDSADEKWISHVNVDFGNEKWASTLGVSYQDIGARTTGSGDEIPFTAYSARAINNKWVYQINDHSNILFDIQYLHQPSTPRVDDLVAGFGQTQPDSELFLFSPNERLFSHIRYQNNAPTSFYDDAEYHVGWQKITDNRVSRDFGDDRTNFEFNSSTLFSLQSVWNKSFDNSNRLVYGLDFYDDTIESRRFRITDAGETVPRSSRFPDDSSMRHLGIFADYHFIFDRTDLTIGARYSDYDIDLNSPTIADDQLDLSDLTWRVSWLYALNDNDRLIANLGRGFRPPNIFDLGQVGERPNNRFNVINPSLDPETVISLDFGWKHAGNGWQAEVVGFVSDYQDVIASVLNGEVTDDGRDIVQSANINEVLIYGLESEVNYFLDNGGQFFGNLTYTWGEEESDGVEGPADRIPPAFGVVGYQQPVSLDWKLKGQIRYASTQDRLSARDLRDARINPNGTGGFTAYDAYATWYTDYGITMRFGIENIFDKKYREHASGLDAPGRNYHISVNYQF